MKKQLLTALVLAVAMFAFAAPKREMRAVWISPVCGDWPSIRIPSSGDTRSAIASQKQQLTTYLDRIKKGNCNALFFHVRPMADAMYPTQYTTWSEYLGEKRGTDPGYDPLAFAIEEAHKRGIELHAWLNPFRYESSGKKHPADDYMRVQHPNWILQIGNQSILDPGLPEVRQHITDITKEIIQNYPEVDGIVWDDYFYISGIGTQDNTSYNKYGNGMNKADWRRDNVNKTVKATYDMIQSINPGIRFGISPPGVWSTSSSAASKYGVSLAPNTTGCWDVYNSIYADGLAWLSQGIIDYISPQVYWPTYFPKPDYKNLTTWWGQMAKKYGRHLYVSQGMSDMSSSNPFKLEDVWAQIQINRDLGSASVQGTVFFCMKEFLNNYLNTKLPQNSYPTPSLTPTITFKTKENLGAASNVVRSNKTLTWTAPAKGRKFAIYHLPTSKANNLREYEKADYLIGMAYGTSMDVSAYKNNYETHRFAVRTLDRFGNESAPAVEVVTAVENTKANNLIVLNTPNGISFELAKTAKVEIFTVDGKMVSNDTYSGHVEIPLNKGCHIIRIDGNVYKIVR